MDHDFPTSAESVVYPHGFYDPIRNVGHINLGTSHDTSHFACDSIGHWWENYGRKAYPNATSILMLCDGGGSNSSRRYIFKYHLEQLATRFQLEIRVAHHPPGCSQARSDRASFFSPCNAGLPRSHIHDDRSGPRKNGRNQHQTGPANNGRDPGRELPDRRKSPCRLQKINADRIRRGASRLELSRHSRQTGKLISDSS